MVHEYGGGALTVGRGITIYSEFSDQRLYRVDTDGPKPVTPEPPRPRSIRYADGRILPDGHMVCVRESHPEEGEAVNELVLIDLDRSSVDVLASGRDFYAAPRPNRDGTQLAWLEWDHPNMPWDGTELKRATLGPDGLEDQVAVAGGESESVAQPAWDASDRLVFVSDRTGWWNLYREDGGSTVPLLPWDADFAEPAWVFGRSSYGFLSGDRIICGHWKDGIHHLGVLESDGTFTGLPDDLADHGRLVTNGRSTAWFIAMGPTSPSAIEEYNVDTGEHRVVHANPVPAPSEYLSRPEVITFPTGNDEVAHGVYYPPTNPDFIAPDGERPPLIVEVHGGPTAHVFPRLSAGILYWTSRGFAVVDVNYRGSTGYGRAFREKLKGNWGIVDVEDCLNAAHFLAAVGQVDGDRLVITGGSAGGYTTLAALAFGEAFSAGASHFGVADIGLLAAHTHKFESRYLDGLVGTDPTVWRQRSPLYSADQISVPVILFQGLEDKVVPPEQAEAIANALHASGVPYAHITYEGEDHGFRKAENIIHSLESELGFYGRVFGFTPAGDIPAIPIVGMD
jgi:dipeptidyl aminopeptidase/acylaminoacyl peptidase